MSKIQDYYSPHRFHSIEFKVWRELDDYGHVQLQHNYVEVDGFFHRLGLGSKTRMYGGNKIDHEFDVMIQYEPVYIDVALTQHEKYLIGGASMTICENKWINIDYSYDIREAPMRDWCKVEYYRIKVPKVLQHEGK